MKYLSRNIDLVKKIDLELIKISGADVFKGKTFNNLFESSLTDLANISTKTEIHFEKENSIRHQQIGSTENLSRFFSFKKMQGAKPTILLHGLEKKSNKILAEIQKLAKSDYWRFNNITASISTKSSSIGYHADMFEVIIYQSKGIRNWKLWHSDKIQKSELQKLQLGILPNGMQCNSKPDFECELHPGEILFIPPYWAHEGTTISNEDSYSFSFCWGLITPAMVLDGLITKENFGEIPNNFLDVYETSSFSKINFEKHLIELIRKQGFQFEKEELKKTLELKSQNLFPHYDGI